MVTKASYGYWKSPITADQVATASKRYDFVDIYQNHIYWVEGRPQEKGRNILMCHSPNGETKEITPPEFNVRSSVHEYGGKPYLIDQGIIYFVNYKDQALYRQNGNQIEKLTNGQVRLAEPIMTPFGIIAIAEKKEEKSVENFLALIDLKSGEIHSLAAGQDFYAAPTLSPDGKRLAWLTWNHPNMPWDGTQLWMAELQNKRLINAHVVAGGAEESIFQPQWSPEGVLYFISDKSGWWNLYRFVEGQTTNMMPIEAEFGRPLWSLGMSTWGFDGNQPIVSYQKDGKWFLARILKQGQSTPVPFETTDIRSFRVNNGLAAFVAGFAAESPKVVCINLSNGISQSINTPQAEPTIDRSYCSIGEPISFPSSSGRKAYAFYYPPKNPDYQAPQGSKPPLLVKAHGGPTGQVSGSFNWLIQFWTSRGFAVVDVNYGGSTGYGRAYRNLLKGNWGIVDREDCEAAAKFLTINGLADPNRLVIDGGSAGGYTVLSALTFGNLFTAGASYFGVSDLALLATETHKFESHYLDRLIGPYPAAKQIYEERSPLQQADLLRRPVIFFQGTEDSIVPPNQAEKLYNVLKKKGITTELILYPGEQHGFRNALTIKDSLEKEIGFYLTIFS